MGIALLVAGPVSEPPFGFRVVVVEDGEAVHNRHIQGDPP
jgi:hypothetical protein